MAPRGGLTRVCVFEPESMDTEPDPVAYSATHASATEAAASAATVPTIIVDWRFGLRACQR